MENEDMLKRNDLMSFISEYLSIELECKKVGQVKWDISRNAPIPNTLNNTYDKLSLKDFFTLYKIDQLVELKIIDKEIGNKLRELLYLKIELGEKIGIIALHNEEEKKNELEKLLKSYNKIEKTFKRYHLLSNRIDLKRLIDNEIKNEKHNIKEQVVIDSETYKEDINIDNVIEYINSLLDDKHNTK